jgi:hypothetical protein
MVRRGLIMMRRMSGGTTRRGGPPNIVAVATKAANRATCARCIRVHEEVGRYSGLWRAIPSTAGLRGKVDGTPGSAAKQCGDTRPWALALALTLANRRAVEMSPGPRLEAAAARGSDQSWWTRTHRTPSRD